MAPTRGQDYVVRIGMTVPEGARLNDVLLRCPADVVQRVHDQLWLRTALVEQRRRVSLAERADFDRRADCLLGLLDPPKEETERIVLGLDDTEAHDVHHALGIAAQLLRQVGAQPGAPLTAESEPRLLRVARRLDHERRHHGAVPNPHEAEGSR